MLTVSSVLGVGLTESLKIIDSIVSIINQLNVDCLLFEVCGRIPRVSTQTLRARNHPPWEVSRYVLFEGPRTSSPHG